MNNNQPLDVMEVMSLICDEKNGLALKLHKAIAYRNASSDHSDSNYCRTLSADTKVVRIRNEIVNVMRRYSLKCEHCEKESVLGRWYLVVNDTQLRCPECNRCTPSNQHKDSYALMDLFCLTPAPLADLFAQEARIKQRI